MLVQIKRGACLKKYQQFPTRTWDKNRKDYIDFYPETYSKYILTTAHKTFRGRIGSLGAEILKIMTKIGHSSLIFIGDEETPWLYRESDFKAAKAALDYLIHYKLGRRFNGALEVDARDLPVFVPHLAWLTRCNTVLPYVYFTDPDHNIIGHICQHGNLHLSFLNFQTEEVFKAHLQHSKLQFLTDTYCS